MRIGIYASAMASDRGHETNVSAHIQLPVHSVRLLHDAGHDVHVITNAFGPEYVMPRAIPEGVTVHLVDDGRKRPKQRRGGGKARGVRPLGLLRQLMQLRALGRDLDVLHFFGLAKTAMLSGMVAQLRPSCPVVTTLVAANLPASPGAAMRHFLARPDAYVSGTEAAAAQLRARHLPVSLVRHGIIRDLVQECASEVERGVIAPPDRPRRRVLFWRDPNVMNGADLCVEAFDAVAPEFPDLTFDLAIRPTRVEVPGIPELEARHPNVNVYRFPYDDGMSLARLIDESILVVLPFRKLTVDPQLAIAESLDAGVPVIASDIRSNGELIEPDHTGAIVPSDDARALTETLRRTLQDRARLDAMRDTTRDRFRATWNWSSYVDDLTALYRQLGVS